MSTSSAVGSSSSYAATSNKSAPYLVADEHGRPRPVANPPPSSSAHSSAGASSIGIRNHGPQRLPLPSIFVARFVTATFTIIYHSILYLFESTGILEGCDVKDPFGGRTLAFVAFKDSSNVGRESSKLIFDVFIMIARHACMADAIQLLVGRFRSAKTVARLGLEKLLLSTERGVFRTMFTAAESSAMARTLTGQEAQRQHTLWRFDLGGIDSNSFVVYLLAEVKIFIEEKRSRMIEDLRFRVLEAMKLGSIAGIKIGDIDFTLGVYSERIARRILVAAKCLRQSNPNSSDSFDSSPALALSIQALAAITTDSDHIEISEKFYASGVIQAVAERFILHVGPRLIANVLTKPIEGRQRWQLPFAILAVPAMMVHSELLLRLHITDNEGLRVVPAISTKMFGDWHKEVSLIEKHAKLLFVAELKARDSLRPSIRYLEDGMGVPTFM